MSSVCVCVCFVNRTFLAVLSVPSMSVINIILYASLPVFSTGLLTVKKCV